MASIMDNIIAGLLVAGGMCTILLAFLAIFKPKELQKSNGSLTDNQKKQLDELLVMYNSMVLLQDHMSYEDIKRCRYCFLQLDASIQYQAKLIGGESAKLYIQSKVSKSRKLIIRV